MEIADERAAKERDDDPGEEASRRDMIRHIQKSSLPQDCIDEFVTKLKDHKMSPQQAQKTLDMIEQKDRATPNRSRRGT